MIYKMYWKKINVVLMLVLLLAMTGFNGQAQAKVSQLPITMKLDGTTLTSDAAPFIVANRVFVPLRVISNGIGAAIQWDASAKSVLIDQGNTEIKLVLGSGTALINELPYTLDVPLQSISGRVFVPLRFVSEQLGLAVNWEPSKRLVALTTSGGISVPGSGNGDTDAGADMPNGSNTLRGAWIASVSNLDWPSKSSLGNEKKQKEEFTNLLDNLQAEGINAVFVQVRPSADALYPSSLVPWSQVLTGTPGKDPGYDPLASMIEAAHQRGMQFHAWFNPFRATTSGTDTSKLPAGHIAKQHPDWIVKQGGKLFLNPGIPAVREHLVEVVQEVVQRYAVDGVHLDDYFYPSDETASNLFADDATYKTYNDKGFSKADWRRNNINTFVRALSASVHHEKPGIVFGISPSGIWRNQATDPTGSATSGRSAYDNEYADARAWIKGQYVDYIAPQVYWSFETSAAPYAKVVDWWANEVRDTGVDLYIGLAPYKIGSPEKGWQSAQEIIKQLQYNEQYSQIDGSIFYRAGSLLGNPLGLTELLKSYYNLN